MTEVMSRAVRRRCSAPDQTGGAFLVTAMRLRSRVDRALRPTGLPYAQYRLLRRLQGGAESRESAGTSEPGSDAQCYELLVTLERAGLVERLGGPFHGPLRVDLTPVGAARLEMAGRQLRLVVAEFGGAFGADEAAELRHLLGEASSGRSRSTGHARLLL